MAFGHHILKHHLALLLILQQVDRNKVKFLDFKDISSE